MNIRYTNIVLSLLLIVSCSTNEINNKNISFNLFAPNPNLTLEDLSSVSLQKVEDIDIDILKYTMGDTIIALYVDSINNSILTETWKFPISDFDSTNFEIFLYKYGFILSPINYDNIGEYASGSYQQFCFQSMMNKRIFICKLFKVGDQVQFVVEYDFIKSSFKTGE